MIAARAIREFFENQLPYRHSEIFNNFCRSTADKSAG
jgi:hypothetical protein